MAMTGGTVREVKRERGNYGNSKNEIALYVYYKTTQNISANTSTITVGMYVQIPSSYNIGPWTDFNGSYVGTKNLTFDGTILNFSGQYWLVEDKSFTVNHNADGTGSATIYWKWGVNSPWGQYQNPSGSFNITLPTIPRASSISVGTLTMGKSGTITINKANSEFTHTISYSFGGTNGTIATKTSGTSVSWTPSLDLAKLIPNSMKGTGTLTCYTFNGATNVGTKSIQFTCNVPDYKPTIGSFNASIDGDAFAKNNNIYVQGKTKALLTMSNCSGEHGSTIKKYYITGDYSNEYTTCTSPFSTGTLNATGSKTFYAQIEDSRGKRSDREQVTITVLPYADPTIKITASRVNGSNSVNINHDVTYSTLGVKNSLKTLTIYKKLSTESVWSSVKTINNPTSSGTTTITECKADKSYDFYAKIIDNAYSSTATSTEVSVGTSFKLVNLDINNNVVAFGKMAEGSNKFECAINADFKKGISAEGNIVFDATGERAIRFQNSSTSTHYHNATLYGGNPESKTDIGIWDTSNSRGVFRYESSANNNNGALFIPMTSIISDASYRCEKDDNEANLNAWLNSWLNEMPNGSCMPCRICCYPAVSGATFSGYLFRYSDTYAHFAGSSYSGQNFYKILNNGIWGNAIVYSYKDIGTRLTAIENRHANGFSSISTNDLQNKPDGWSGYGRVLRFGDAGATDRYYLLIDSNGRFWTGTQINNSAQITWREK